MLDPSHVLLATDVLLRAASFPGDAQHVLRARLEAHARQRFVHVAGDLAIDGDLRLDWNDAFWTGRHLGGLLVDGDLRVTGTITNLDLNDGPTLVVLGRVEASRVVHGGSAWLIGRELRVTETLFGDYNDGYLFVGGDLAASAVIVADHDISVIGQTLGRRIDFDQGHAWLADGLFDEALGEVDWEAVTERARRGEPLLRTTPRRIDILAAAIESDPEHLRMAIAQGADLEVRDRSGATPLLAAILEERTANVEILLAAGASVHAVDDQGQGAAHRLTFGEKAELIAAVLARRPPLDRPDAEGRTPMMRALEYHNLECVMAFRKQGIALPAPAPGTSYPYSLRLAETTRLELLDYLVADGLPLDWREPGDDIFPGGKTLLHEAAWRGHRDAVERLLRAGATVDIADDRGRTPLRLLLELAPTIHRGDDALVAAIARLLLAAGADPLAPAQDRRDALDLALASALPETRRVVADAAVASGRLSAERRAAVAAGLRG